MADAGLIRRHGRRRVLGHASDRRGPNPLSRPDVPDRACRLTWDEVSECRALLLAAPAAALRGAFVAELSGR